LTDNLLVVQCALRILPVEPATKVSSDGGFRNLLARHLQNTVSANERRNSAANRADNRLQIFQS
jgi:hypothetical protein